MKSLTSPSSLLILRMKMSLGCLLNRVGALSSLCYVIHTTLTDTNPLFNGEVIYHRVSIFERLLPQKCSSKVAANHFSKAEGTQGKI